MREKGEGQKLEPEITPSVLGNGGEGAGAFLLVPAQGSGSLVLLSTHKVKERRRSFLSYQAHLPDP